MKLKKRFRNHSELRKEATNIASRMTDDEFFESVTFEEFAQKIAEAISKDYGVVKVYLYHNENDDTTAYTTPYHEVFVNTKNCIIRSLNRKDRFVAIIAHVLHECAHILFTDFSLMEKGYDAIACTGSFFPAPECKEADEALKDIKARPEIWGMLASIWKYIFNSLEDGCVDELSMNENRGYAVNRRWLLDFMYETNIIAYESVKDKKAIEVLPMLMLSYGKFHKIKAKSESLGDELIRKFFSFRDDIDKALIQTSPYFRQKKINEVFCKFYLFAKKEFEEQQKQEQGQPGQQGQGDQQNSGGQQSQGSQSAEQNQQGQASGEQQGSSGQQNASQQGSQSQSTQGQPGSNSSSNGQGQEFNNFLNQLNQMMQSSGEAKEAEKSKHASTSNLKKMEEKEVKKDSSSHTSSSNPNSGSEHGMGKELQKLVEKEAENKAMEKSEKEFQKSLKSELSSMDFGKVHAGVSSFVKRPTPGNIDSSTYAETRMIADRLSRELKRQIKKRRLGQTMNGLYLGRRITQPHRFDKKIMGKNISPENIPDLSICLLIDESGSMSGERIKIAKKAALIMKQFCDEVDVPIAIYGHSWRNSSVALNAYCEFEDTDKKDLFRLSNISAHGCNRDGYALKFCCERLVKQPSDDKIMMIISDGKPNADGYKGDIAKKDIQEILKMFGKKHVKFITAGIGDQEELHKIYVNGFSEKTAAKFLDIRNLEELPKTLIKILQKFLEK